MYEWYQINEWLLHFCVSVPNRKIQLLYCCTISPITSKLQQRTSFETKKKLRKGNFKSFTRTCHFHNLFLIHVDSNSREKTSEYILNLDNSCALVFTKIAHSFDVISCQNNFFSIWALCFHRKFTFGKSNKWLKKLPKSWFHEIISKSKFLSFFHTYQNQCLT